MNVLGVDIGGTKVAAGVVNESGEILEQFRAPMSARGTAEEGFASVAAAIDGIRAAGTRFEAIGIVSPGPLDPTAGVVVNPPNVPCWRNYPLTDAVRGKYGLPTYLD